LAVLLPGLAVAGRRAEHHAGTERSVVGEVLLGVESRATARAGALDSRRRAPRAEPRLTDARAQRPVVVELGARLDERRRGEDPAGRDRGRVVGVGVDRVVVADRPGE